MRVEIIEISGYASAIRSMYMTNRSLTEEKKIEIHRLVEAVTDRWGFYKEDANPQDLEKFNKEMIKLINYGIRHGHHQLLKFIDVHIDMQGLHRGAQDDYDAHAKRLEIIRSTTRTLKGANHPEFSDFYKDKIMTFDEMYRLCMSGGSTMPEEMGLLNGVTYVKTSWGYVNKEYANNPDVRRGLVPLGIASDNLSKVPYGEHLPHIYSLRRENPNGKPANPELQQTMEELRNDLKRKSPILGEYLGKVWVESDGGFFAEENLTIRVVKPK